MRKNRIGGGAARAILLAATALSPAALAQEAAEPAPVAIAPPPAAIAASAPADAGLGAAAAGAAFGIPEGEAPIIQSIRVQGNQRIEPETIASYLVVAPGDRAEPELLDLGLKTLFNTGLFADVTLACSRAMSS